MKRKLKHILNKTQYAEKHMYMYMHMYLPGESSFSPKILQPQDEHAYRMAKTVTYPFTHRVMNQFYKPDQVFLFSDLEVHGPHFA